MNSLTCSNITVRSIPAFKCRLITNRLPLIHLFIAMTNRYVPIAKAITGEPIIEQYVNSMYCSMMAIQKPNGFLQSNGNLHQITKILNKNARSLNALSGRFCLTTSNISIQMPHFPHRLKSK